MGTPLDGHGQPNPAFNYQRNRRKAMKSMLGLLDGAVADMRLRELEIAFLDTWLRDNQHHLSGDGDAHEVLEFAQVALQNQCAEGQHIDDMRGVIHGILQDREAEAFADPTDSINYLIGLTHGVLADNHLHDHEIQRIDNWLKDVEGLEVADRWPVNVLRERVAAILEDEVITEDERADLVETLQRINGGGLNEGITGGLSSTLAATECDWVNFPSRSFCLTGKFLFGPRRRCEAEIERVGGRVAGGITKKLDYLVIGGAESRDWAHSSFGRKIEKAQAYAQQGTGLEILTEKTWLRCLTDY